MFAVCLGSWHTANSVFAVCPGSRLTAKGRPQHLALSPRPAHPRTTHTRSPPTPARRAAIRSPQTVLCLLCLPCALPLRHTTNRRFNGVSTSALYFAECPIMHTAKCLSCARNVAHCKLTLCRPLFAVSCLPCVTLGKVFAECKLAFAVCP